MWEFYNGPIPAGYEIHHKDHNPENNDISNLECLPCNEHHKEHREEASLRGRSPEHLEHLRRARELTKEWHHSSEGRAWHSEHSKKQFEDLPVRDAVCECCGRAFQYKSFNIPRFCSNSCKSKWRRDAGLDNEVRTCVYCGKQFETNHYSDTLTCSKSCAAKYRWRKRRGGGGV